MTELVSTAVQATASSTTAAANTTGVIVGAAVGAAVGSSITAVPATVDAVGRWADRLDALTDFFFGESKTPAQDLHERQREIEREARRAQHRARDDQARITELERRADARARNPQVQQRLAAGQSDFELESLVSQAELLKSRAESCFQNSTNLQSFADGLAQVAVDARMIEAGTMAAEVMETANAAVAATGDAEELGDRITDARDQMKDNTRTIQRALAGRQNASRSRNAGSAAIMQRYRTQAAEAVMNQERGSAATSRASPLSSSAPRRVPVAVEEAELQERLTRLNAK